MRASTIPEVVVPLHRLVRDPLMRTHFGERLRELDDLTEAEYAGLREYAQQAEAAVAAAGRQGELRRALTGVDAWRSNLQTALGENSCQHCWYKLAPGQTRYHAHCEPAAWTAGPRRANGLHASYNWGSITPDPYSTLFVADQVARFSVLSVLTSDLFEKETTELLQPLWSTLED